jgi:hypothetical protein
LQTPNINDEIYKNIISNSNINHKSNIFYFDEVRVPIDVYDQLYLTKEQYAPLVTKHRNFMEIITNYIYDKYDPNTDNPDPNPLQYILLLLLLSVRRKLIGNYIKDNAYISQSLEEKIRKLYNNPEVSLDEIIIDNNENQININGQISLILGKEDSIFSLVSFDSDTKYINETDADYDLETTKTINDRIAQRRAIIRDRPRTAAPAVGQGRGNNGQPRRVNRVPVEPGQAQVVVPEVGQAQNAAPAVGQAQGNRNQQRVVRR